MEKTEKATDKRRNKSRSDGQKLTLSVFEGLVSMLLYGLGVFYMAESSLIKVKDFFYDCVGFDCTSLESLLTEIIKLMLVCVVPFFSSLIVSATYNKGIVLRFKIFRPPNLLENVKYFTWKKISPIVNMFFVSSNLIVIFVLFLWYFYHEEYLTDIKLLMKYYPFFIGLCLFYVICLSLCLEFFVQRGIQEKGMKMSKYDIKKENEEDYGKPIIKQHIKKVQNEILSGVDQMNIKNAQVRIVNPTHIFIAISFDQSKLPVPHIIACYSGIKALQARRYSESQGLKVHENVVMARSILKDYQAKPSRLLPAKYFVDFHQYWKRSRSNIV